MIPKTLQILKAELSWKNFRKVANLLLTFLSKLKSLENNKYRHEFTAHLYKAYVEFLHQPQYENEEKFTRDQIISYACNSLYAFKCEGAKKEFFTFLSENPSKPQLVNTNKKYPKFV